ncbi:cytidylate kinase [Gemmatimonadetes bacterium T265]|nr:cytidylate kinase [Gemmatimonadetes bacterium T265]
MTVAAGARARPVVVAIDGPAASGKSSTARWVAERLGYHHVDSGALYRAATLLAMREHGPAPRWTGEALAAAAERITLTPVPAGFDPAIDGVSVAEAVRGTEVTRNVSAVAQMPPVRAWVNARVRAAATAHSVVVDGRDIGTVVFPDAALKVFLVADPWERARRRLLQEHGRAPSDAEIAAETDRLVQRDARDATQTVQARDAVLLDTTFLTQSEQVDRIVSLARALPAAGRPAAPTGVEPRDEAGSGA